ncbi:MAG TPA: hypothetical protein VIJ25_10615, partial [Methylococcales bacterium]
QDACGRRKLSLLFYGYVYELRGNGGAHYAMEHVLRSPDVHVLVSPLSYQDRQIGGHGGFMTAVDSVSAHNKLWIVENDYRTHAVAFDKLPEWMTVEQLGPKTENLQETLGVLRRDFGAMLTHRCGTWWMDLLSVGAFEVPEIWTVVKNEFLPICKDTLANAGPFKPEVAVIIDENSHCALRFEGQWPTEVLNPVFASGCWHARKHFGRSGTDVGYYYLGDLINGKVPQCKLYVFLNHYQTDEQTINRIHQILSEAGATALWQYACGYLTESGVSAEQMGRLVGMKIQTDRGELGTVGQDCLQSLRWGKNVSLNPRCIVKDSTAGPWGNYQDGNVSTACKDMGKWKSIFTGEIDLSAEMLLKLYEVCGVHTWTRDGNSIVYSDGRYLFVHSGQSGKHEIYVPQSAVIECMTGDMDGIHANRVSIDFYKGQTHCFKLFSNVKGS